ncbi:MAG: glycosyltransferase family 2 protein [bacterium]|nr:glycosyltransferase family 2 protein [bacterium]
MRKLDQAPVSVVIPCYRSARTIERAIESVAAQTWPPAEVIAVDDASDDRTPDLLELLVARYPWLKTIRLEHNQGPASARNAGWDAATQRFLAFLDADDAWHPQKLEVQATWMKDHPEFVITGHGSRKVTDWPQAGPAVSSPSPVITLTPAAMLRSNQLSTRTVMVRRDISLRFCPGKRYAEDYLLWLQILLEGHPGARLDCDLAYSFKSPFGDAGLSAHLLRFEMGEIDAYVRLARQRHISWRLLAILVPYSAAKYVRRLALSLVRR